LNDSLFDVPPLAPATPGQFRDRVAGELRQHGCSGVHRTIEIAGDPVMYALQAEGEIRVVPGDFLIEGVTLAEGRGGHSEHVLIVDGRWPTLEAYLSGRA
jgi:hypothetical protein